MEALSVPEREYLSSVHAQPERVRRLMATGSTNAIYEYDDPKCNKLRCLKVPLARISRKIRQRAYDLFTRQEPKDAQEELRLCNQYFEPYVVPTDFEVSPDGQNFAFIQDTIDIVPIDKQTVRQDIDIRLQLEDITDRNGKMVRDEKVWLDMMGMNGWKLPGLIVGQPYLDNVVLERETKQVKIIDYGLFTLNAKHRAQYITQHMNAWLYGLSFTGKSRT